MSYNVRKLPKAKQDKNNIFRWLNERSPVGAAAWLEACDAVLDRLKQGAASFGAAAECTEPCFSSK
jgi:hypothetical protein